MPKMLFDLTDDQKAKLERLRQFHGLRSWTEVVRKLVDDAPSVAIQVAPFAMTEPTNMPAPKPRPKSGSSGQRIIDGLKEAVAVASGDDAAGRSHVPLAGTFERKPYQKGMGKAKR